MKKTNLNKLETILQVFRADLYERIDAYALLKNKKVLDLGCGDGEDAVNLAQYAKEIIGLDISKFPAWKKIKTKNVSFVVGKSEKIPFKDNTFNGLFLKDVLHHVTDIEKSLQEIKRVTTPKATIILVEGNRYNPLFYFYATKMQGHEHLTQKNLEKVIKKYFPKATFEYVECYPPFFIRDIALYKKLLSLQKKVNKINFLKPLFSYNVAIIKNS